MSTCFMPHCFASEASAKLSSFECCADSTTAICDVSLRTAPALFFFSSRRRHTRSLRDWSSDVCSSDLAWLEEHRDAALADVVHVAAVGRTHFSERLALPASDGARLRELLRDAAQGRI